MAGFAERLYGAVIQLTALVPPRWRYGYVLPVLRRTLRPELAVLRSADAATPSGTLTQVDVPPRAPRCLLIADRLDVGGIGSVVEMLALQLRDEGIETAVLCSADGARATALRGAGVRVRVAAPGESSVLVIRELAPDVIQLHGASHEMEHAALTSGVPFVPVLHNTEIHFTPRRWQAVGELIRRSAATIAVSELVARFHEGHLRPDERNHVRVVANGAPLLPLPTFEERTQARVALENLLHTPLTNAVVFVTLARYDAQKNIAGTVASFLHAVSTRRTTPTHPGDLHLVVAGEPSDAAEARRATALIRAHPCGRFVHLLGTSDARTLLRASDGFILDSFFEGWPVAATEAAVAGLPLILSEVGGGAELVARDERRSVLIPNPSGPPYAVDDRAVRRARRRTRAQANRAAFADAVHDVAARVRSGDTTVDAEAREQNGLAPMVREHARILRDAAASARGDVSVADDE